MRRLPMLIAVTRRPTGNNGATSPRWPPAIALLLLGLVLAGPTAAQQPAATTPAEQAADDLNRDLLRVYSTAKMARLQQTPPLIVIASVASLVIRSGGGPHVAFRPG